MMKRQAEQVQNKLKERLRVGVKKAMRQNSKNLLHKLASQKIEMVTTPPLQEN